MPLKHPLLRPAIAMLLTAWVTASCATPSATEGYWSCAAESDCLAGFVCSSGTCVARAAGSPTEDAAGDDVATEVDTPQPDGANTDDRGLVDGPDPDGTPSVDADASVGTDSDVGKEPDADASVPTDNGGGSSDASNDSGPAPDGISEPDIVPDVDGTDGGATTSDVADVADVGPPPCDPPDQAGTLCDGPDADPCTEGVWECIAGELVCSDLTGDSIESCGGGDENCDGQVDEPGAQGCSIFYEDADSDGVGVGEGQCLCAGVGMMTATIAGDCDDTNGAINPLLVEGLLQPESCTDTFDNDCDGTTDIGEPECSEASCEAACDACGLGQCCAGVSNGCVGQKCSASCPTDCSCHLSCLEDAGTGSNCELACDGSSFCPMTCDGQPSKCDVTCSGNATCQIAAQETFTLNAICSGSSCTIDCTAANKCNNVVCTEGSSCVVDCGTNPTCGFGTCSPGQVTDCGGGVIVCNRPCP